MSNQKLKQLAEIIISEQKVNESVAEFIFKKLSKKELKTFLSFLKNARNKNLVIVKTSEKMSDNFANELKKFFGDKELSFQIDSTVGAGMFIQDSDIIIDLTVENFINKTINSLKKEL